MRMTLPSDCLVPLKADMWTLPGVPWGGTTQMIDDQRWVSGRMVALDKCAVVFIIVIVIIITEMISTVLFATYGQGFMQKFVPTGGGVIPLLGYRLDHGDFVLLFQDRIEPTCFGAYTPTPQWGNCCSYWECFLKIL